MKRMKAAVLAVCLVCALTAAAAARAEALSGLGVLTQEQTQPETLRLTGARLLRFERGDAQEVSLNDTDAGAYLLDQAGATLTLAPEQTAALTTLAGQAVEFAAGEAGALSIPAGEEPLRLTITAPEQPAQSWLLFFTEEQVQAQCGDQDDGWTYAAVEHVVRFADAEGNPVPQVFVNVCTDTLCTAYFSDAGGEVSFSGDESDYVMHVLQVPEGYAFDTAQEILIPAGQGYATVILEKAS